MDCYYRRKARFRANYVAMSKHKFVLLHLEGESCQYAFACSSITGMGRRL
jgi:hypothetical protein